MATLDNNHASKSIYQAKPDIRFATTFLSNKYRDHAVKGEVIMDKVTGELFVKRKEDGRVVSFYQNKKNINNMMDSLRFGLRVNPKFVIPNDSNPDSFFVNTDYDVMTINKEKEVNIALNHFELPEEVSRPESTIKFKVSKFTNGFFINASTRDSDKTIVEWLNSQYNNLVKNFKGSNELIDSEKSKFDQISTWKDNNATIRYNIKITYNEDTVVPIIETITTHIRLNENCVIVFPDNISAKISKPDTGKTIKSVEVDIDGIFFEKIQFMLKNKALFGDEFITNINKFIYPDNSILFRYITVSNFVDNSDDIDLKNNEFIVMAIDTAYCYKVMNRIATLYDNPTIIYSSIRPNMGLWRTGTLWAEPINIINSFGGKSTELEHITDIRTLERILAGDKTIGNFVSITRNTGDEANILATGVETGTIPSGV